VATEFTYRCLGCLDHTVTREFDVSHVSVTCPECGSFERLVNERVVEQFRAFEDAPPEGFDWNRLDRREKLFVAERVARRGRDIEEFDLAEVRDGDAEGDDESD
jgi:DNA-directed RNA polymerase subunit RPC12/RpoP